MKNLIISGLLMMIMGCGYEAAVQTRDGHYYTGEITGHDSGHIYLDGKSIPKSQITDIDHPGNVAGIIGTIVASVGIVTGLSNCGQEQRNANPNACTSSGVWLLTGLPIAIYGWVVHSDSVDSAGSQIGMGYSPPEY